MGEVQVPPISLEEVHYIRSTRICEEDDVDDIKCIEGRIYASNRNKHSIHIYDSHTHSLIRSIGGEGSGAGQLKNPMGMCFHSNYMYICEEYHRISIFDLDGNYIKSFGSLGQKNKQFQHPSYICTDGERLFVADSCNHRVQIFSMELVYISTIGGNGSGSAHGKLNYPEGILITADGLLHICDCNNHRVEVYSRLGEYVRSMGGGEGGAEYKFKWPYNICVDMLGHIYVADRGNNCLKVYTGEGKYIRRITSDGLVQPISVCATIHPSTGSMRIYAGSQVTRKVHLYGNMD